MSKIKDFFINHGEGIIITLTAIGFMATAAIAADKIDKKKRKRMGCLDVPLKKHVDYMQDYGQSPFETICQWFGIPDKDKQDVKDILNIKD